MQITPETYLLVSMLTLFYSELSDNTSLIAQILVKKPLAIFYAKGLMGYAPELLFY